MDIIRDEPLESIGNGIYVIRGRGAKAIYDQVDTVFEDNVKYVPETKEIIYSNYFLVVGIDKILRQYGLRTLNLRDLSLPEVMAFVEGKHYIDGRSLVARSLRDSWSKNDSLLKTIYEFAEEKEGKIKGPFMIEEFGFVSTEDERGYGIILVAEDDFRVIQDERLEGKNNGRKFSEVDEWGLPLFDKNGKRTWYARDEGLSGVCLSRYLDLYSFEGNLDFSNGNGRLVVRSARDAELDERLFMSPREKAMNGEFGEASLNILALQNRLNLAVIQEDFKTAAFLKKQLEEIVKRK